MLTDPRVSHGFDRLSSVYDACVKLVFGNSISDFTKSSLLLLNPAEHCLIVGGGSGQVLVDAFDRELANHYIYCELSPKIIEAAKKRISQDDETRVSFIQNVETELGNNSIDIVIFPFVLDCFHESSINQLFGNLNPHLTENSQVLIIDFNREPIAGFAPSLFQKFFIAILYFFFRLFTGIEAKELPHIFSIMQKRGWTLIRNNSIKNGWIQGSLWAQNQFGLK